MVIYMFSLLVFFVGFLCIFILSFLNFTFELALLERTWKASFDKVLWSIFIRMSFSYISLKCC